MRSSGGDGIPEGECDCDGNVDEGCGCGEPGPSGCDETCGSTAEVDECEICGGIGITDQRCGCDDEDGIPDFSCIPGDPSGFEIAVDSQKGSLFVEKAITFKFADLSENICLEGRARKRACRAAHVPERRHPQSLDLKSGSL